MTWDEDETAARMLGAAVAIEETTTETPQGYAVHAFAETSAPVMDRLSEPRIAAAFAAGQGMSYQEAAAFALAAVSDRAPL